VLHLVAVQGLWKLGCKLLKVPGIDVNYPAKDGSRALHCCSRTLSSKDFDPKFVKQLLALGAHVNPVNNLGQTPLHSCCLRGSVKFARLLLEAHADVNAVTKEHHETCLHYAVRGGFTELAVLLLQFNADPGILSSNGLTPLDIAINQNMNAMVNALRNAYLSSQPQ
jgi:ankyrin repeat protein